MSEKARTPYQQEMDELHVPEEKANETLNMMLAENRRLRQKEAGGKRSFAANPKFWGGFATAAAVCAALLLAFLPGRNSGVYTFAAVDYFALPSAGTYRAEADNTLLLEDTLHVSADDLFPGWELRWESVSSIPSEGENAYIARLALMQGERMMDAEVTNREPELYGAIAEEQTLNGRKIRLAKDEKWGLVFAVYKENDLYITLSGQMNEDEMVQTLQGIMK